MLNHKDMKYLTLTQTEGRIITRVFDCDNGWKEFKTNTRVPGSKFLMNYYIEFGGRKVLLLDDYGNDHMPPEVEKRLFGQFAGKWLLGIDRETGELLGFSFYRVKRETIAVFVRFASNPKVPKRYLTEANLLFIKSCKRPWVCRWKHENWLALWDRDMTWDDFSASMVFQLELIRPATRRVTVTRRKRPIQRYLEVWGDSHRIVTDWRS